MMTIKSLNCRMLFLMTKTLWTIKYKHKTQSFKGEDDQIKSILLQRKSCYSVLNIGSKKNQKDWIVLLYMAGELEYISLIKKGVKSEIKFEVNSFKTETPPGKQDLVCWFPVCCNRENVKNKYLFFCVCVSCELFTSVQSCFPVFLQSDPKR